MIKVFLWAVLLMLVICGCEKAAQPTVASQPGFPSIPTRAQPRLQTVKLWLGAEELITELALTDSQRQAGMMFRTNMPENEGMLFVFPVPHQTGFWMMNTFVPLSAAYIDPEGVILELHDLEPHNTNTVMAASARIQYVLETNRDWFKRHNVGVGTVIKTERGTLPETFFRRRM